MSTHHVSTHQPMRTGSDEHNPLELRHFPVLQTALIPGRKMLSDNRLTSAPLRPNRSREVPRDSESILLVRAECTHYLIVQLLVAGF